MNRRTPKSAKLELRAGKATNRGEQPLSLTQPLLPTEMANAEKAWWNPPSQKGDVVDSA
jgi:hypothetical protein